MKASLQDRGRTTTRGGWLALAAVAAAFGAWFAVSLPAPTTTRPADAVKSGAPAEADHDERHVDRWTGVPRGADPWTFEPGTATVSPYDVMVAMADLEALGDRLAMLRLAGEAPLDQAGMP